MSKSNVYQTIKYYSGYLLIYTIWAYPKRLRELKISKNTLSLYYERLKNNTTLLKKNFKKCIDENKQYLTTNFLKNFEDTLKNANKDNPAIINENLHYLFLIAQRILKDRKIKLLFFNRLYPLLSENFSIIHAYVSLYVKNISKNNHFPYKSLLWKSDFKQMELMTNEY